jgi:hypothetical protein
MHSQRHASLKQKGRLRLVIQQLELGRCIAELAPENGISICCY